MGDKKIRKKLANKFTSGGVTYEYWECEDGTQEFRKEVIISKNEYEFERLTSQTTKGNPLIGKEYKKD